MKRLFYGGVFAALIALLALSILLGLVVGPVYIPPTKIVEIVLSQVATPIVHVFGARPPIRIDNESTSYIIVTQIREPRTLAAAIGGAALAIAGLLFQILFRNPIVGPYVLGVSSGAALMVGAAILLGVTFGLGPLYSPHTIVALAFVGALVVSSLMLSAAAVIRSAVTLLVMGLMVGYLCSSLTTIMITIAQKQQVKAFIMWSFGSFAGYEWSDVVTTYEILVPVIIASLALARPMNLMLLGEDYAKTMGLDVKKLRVAVIGVSSALTATVTAFAGPVGFIGVAVPHLARIVMRTSNSAVLIPASALLGGIVTVLCDVVSRILIPPIALPISAVTSLFGAPLIIALLLKRRARL